MEGCTDRRDRMGKRPDRCVDGNELHGERACKFTYLTSQGIKMCFDCLQCYDIKTGEYVEIKHQR